MLKWLDKYLENVIACSLLAIMVGAIFLQVVTRTLNFSLTWTEELARYCMIWLVYIGLSFAVAKRSHIRIDAINMLLDKKEQHYLSLLASTVFLVFATVILYKSTQMVINLQMLGQSSPALGLPMWTVYLAAPVGFGLAVIRLIQQMFATYESLDSLEEGGN
ncbi:TRAP transporter small permease [Aliagarivorans marinus]|uniref:TRAP transporter small permease n=1 Tax=Aliagarivorans marinus TaxID=561965 RepID=UPI0003F87E3A|nr:TRAP transporter small permease [Aliagarivorans marinus]